MRLTLAVAACAALVGAAACGPRQVEVRTAPTVTANTAAIHMTNNASQAVNVYVTSGGSDIFVGQVASLETKHLPVNGVATGSIVTLKATTVDGQTTYTKQNVTLGDTMYAWQVP